MTWEAMRDLFENHSDYGEYIRFERVTNKRSNRSDLHAFLLLDELVPGERDLVDGAEHDEIYLSVTLRELAAVINEDQILELVRCGVRCSYEGLSMFV